MFRYSERLQSAGKTTAQKRAIIYDTSTWGVTKDKRCFNHTSLLWHNYPIRWSEMVPRKKTPPWHIMQSSGKAVQRKSVLTYRQGRAAWRPMAGGPCRSSARWSWGWGCPPHGSRDWQPPRAPGPESRGTPESLGALKESEQGGGDGGKQGTCAA